MQQNGEREGGAPSTPKGSYGVEGIVVLEGLEAVRRRPGMYIGNVQDGSGLHHMVWEIVANAIDEHLGTHARAMRIDLDDGWVSVEDDGRGIPVGILPRHGASALEIVFTVMHHGPTWDGHHPHVHIGGGSHGVGGAAVSALCERLEVRTHRDGHAWHIAFERGRVATPLTDLGPSTRRGTCVRFLPDPSIFGAGARLDPAILEPRLQEIAWLNPLLAVTWRGRALPGQGGIPSWVRSIAGPIATGTVVSARGVIDEADSDVALAWRDDATQPAEIHSFVSQCSSRDGGTHVQGLWAGITSALASLAPGVAPKVRREIAARGLVAIVNVGLYQPQWGAPTKDRLLSPVAKQVTKRAVHDALVRALPSYDHDREGSLAHHLRQRFLR